MDTEAESPETSKAFLPRPRPVILTTFCIFSFVFFGLLCLFFLAGLFNTGWITKVINQYVATGEWTIAQIMLICGGGFLLHGLAFTGVILIWNLRKKGYYFLGISCLIIAIYQLVNPSMAITSTAIYIMIIIFFGLFFRRLN
jgi:hypothetical protein